MCIPTFTFIRPVCYTKAGSFQVKSHKWMLSLGAELIWLVLACWWLLTGGLSLPCFLFTATLAVRRRAHLYTRLTGTPQQALKSVWNYISSILWTTCKWNLSQCCWKCHLSPPCLPSRWQGLTHILVHPLDLNDVSLNENAVETVSKWTSLKAQWQLDFMWWSVSVNINISLSSSASFPFEDRR